MKHTISPDRKTLTIEIDDQEQQELRNWDEDHQDSIHSDISMIDFFERLTCNSEISWVSDEDAYLQFGDLTEAPCLGIYDYINEEPKLSERWRFMSYETVSVLETLMGKGKAVFVS